ncbi:MAG: cation diffusion facilitator family transporter [Deltaproteobacteria bacterium]|nr:cation diffusion facilitator family transporter [Deltaproteobacteria bacterium]
MRLELESDEALLGDSSPSDPPGRASTLKACWIAFWSCVGLALFKVAGGTLGYNPLLLLDGLTSAAVAVVITTIILGVHMSSEENTSRRYAYGKGKVQYLMALLAGFVLVVAAILTLGVAIKSFFEPADLRSAAIGMLIALVPIFGNVLLLVYLRQFRAPSIGNEFRRVSRLLMLSIGSSLVVVQSFILTEFGFVLGDRIGRLSISLIVIWLGTMVIKSSLDGVMDRRTGKDVESHIRLLASSVDDVQRVEWVRTRRTGQTTHIDLGLALDGSLTIRQSDMVAEKVKRLLSKKMAQSEKTVSVEFCAL